MIMDMQTINDGIKGCALIGRTNISLSYILQELSIYTNCYISRYTPGSSPHLIFYKNNYIAFA